MTDDNNLKSSMSQSVAETSTQTENENRDVKLASSIFKSICIHTDPVRLERYSIREATSQLSESKEKDNERKEECEEGEEDDLENELQRRLNPKTPEDFELLQSELMQWKQRQNRKIVVTARNPLHKKEMTVKLLEDEAKLIRKIETLKVAASETWKMEKLEKIMEQMTMTKEWGTADGMLISVETPEIVRAREMKDAFAELKKNVVNVRDRIELLQNARTLIEKSGDHSALAKDVSSLLDRELEMLNTTELGSVFLVGLRKRMLNSFAKLVTHDNHVVSKAKKAKFKVHSQKPEDRQLF